MRKLICFILICAIALPMGCYHSSEPETLKFDDRVRITAILPQSFAYWDYIGQSIIDSASLLDVDVKVINPDINYDVVQMSELIREATASKVDAIIVQGIDDEDYINSLKNAKSQGIQIVFVDTDVSDFEGRLYVGTDNYNAGFEMGKELISRVGTDGEVAIISGIQGFKNLEERIEGIKDAVADTEFKIVDIVYNNHDLFTMAQVFNGLTKDYPSLDYILCVEGLAGMMIGDGLYIDRDDSIEYVIAFDVSEDVLNGLSNRNIDASMVQQMYEMGYNCVLEIIRFSETGSYSSDEIYTGINIIDAENYEEYLHYE